MVTDWKKWKSYDTMSDDEKKLFDEGTTKRLESLEKKDGEIKYSAEYHKMTQDEKDMYNKILNT